MVEISLSACFSILYFRQEIMIICFYLYMYVVIRSGFIFSDASLNNFETTDLSVNLTVSKDKMRGSAELLTDPTSSVLKTLTDISVNVVRQRCG